MKRAFTLPEMLVVLGVIVVLIAILFPIIGRVREAANQALCMSRRRQVAQATIMYCADNEGSFPGSGNGMGSGAPHPIPPYDWIYWDANAPAPFNDVTQSTLGKYMSITNGDVFRCPSDTLYRPSPNPAHATESPYYFSFSLNAYLGNGPDYWPSSNIKLGQVKKPATLILYIDEDERTVNDGAWVAWSYDRLSTRHDVHKDVNDPTGRGNVVFCDGHGEFVTRALTYNWVNYYFPD
jgi:prepilin-type N-terminal cleavage/methylation domain-containing protein/prepilin-type processing-associated H-X9-DG protein